MEKRKGLITLQSMRNGGIFGFQTKLHLCCEHATHRRNERIHGAVIVKTDEEQKKIFVDFDRQQPLNVLWRRTVALAD